MTPLDPELAQQIKMTFKPDDWSAAIALLEMDCGDTLPLIASQGSDGILRVRCAAVKLSEGSLEKLRRAVDIANDDWRDVLVAAGFANSLSAHQVWLRQR